MPIIIQLSYIKALTLPFFIFTAFIVEIIQYNGDLMKILSTQTTIVRWVIYLLLITSLIIFGTHGFFEPSQFIYFQF
jgi:hypothetical protein